MLSLQSITLNNWRNLTHKEVEFSPKLTILLGENASGKTNTIEAIQLLTTGHSFRHAKAENYLTPKHDIAEAKLTIHGDNRELDTQVIIAEGKKQFMRLGKKMPSKEIAQDILPILFIPDDLNLIKQSARYRRGELDYFGSLAHPAYAQLLSDYNKVLSHRNALLKEWPPNYELLDVLDDQLARIGARLLKHRIQLFELLSEITSDVYKELTNGEQLTMSYECSFMPDITAKGEQIVYDEFLKTLHDTRDEDLRYNQTTTGPHRDNYSFYIQSRDARTYASQGQQRTAVLSLKFAEVNFTRDRLEKEPILLLDDVMSELDEMRRDAICTYIQEGIQTVITTTNIAYFNDDLLQDASVVTYKRT